MTIELLLKNKVPDFAEIEIFLFEYCNLKCVHCFQNHDSKIGMSEENIFSKLEIIENFFKNTSKNYIILNIMGGELFLDDIMDDYLKIYSEFIYKVNNFAVIYNKKIKFNFVTNLLTTKHDLFKSWLIKHDLKLSVSYDLSGRFNINQLLQFKHNIELYKDHIRLICLVATRHNIDLLIRGQDKYYDYLYNHFECYWDQLTPGPTVPTDLVPSEKEYFIFLKYLIDNYPKCSNLESFINKKEQNKMSCPSINKLLIESNNNTSSCRIQQHKKSNDFISVVNDKNDTIIENWINEKGCLTCEYFQKCSFSCFVRNDWKRLVRDFEGCIYKETFKYVDSKNGFDN